MLYINRARIYSTKSALPPTKAPNTLFPMLFLFDSNVVFIKYKPPMNRFIKEKIIRM